MRLFPEHTKRGDFRLFPCLGPRSVCEHLEAGSACSLVPGIATAVEMLRTSGRPAPAADARRGARAFQLPLTVLLFIGAVVGVATQKPRWWGAYWLTCHFSVQHRGHCEVQCVSPKNKKGKL